MVAVENATRSAKGRPRFFFGFLVLLGILLVATFCIVRFVGSTPNGPIVAISFQAIGTNAVGSEAATFQLRNLRRNPVEIDSFCVWEFSGGKNAQAAAIANHPIPSAIVVEPSGTTVIQVEMAQQWPARVQFICLERRTLSDKIRGVLPSPFKNLLSGSRREPIFSDWVASPLPAAQR